MTSDTDLEAQLAEAGIASRYTDGFGSSRQVPMATLLRLLTILSGEQLTSSSETSSVTAPCYLPESLVQGERWWGLSVQLYSLRSRRNWGIGDFTDLRSLGLLAADVGADFLAVNPLHARSLAVPELCSPYSPTSRLFLDPLYVDPEAVVDYEESPELRQEIEDANWQKQIAYLRSLELIDYAGVCRVKLQVFRKLHRHFCIHHLELDTSRAREFLRFTKEGGTRLAHYAHYEARRLTTALGEPAAIEELTGLHCYLQWIAGIQLEKAASALRQAGMRIGLYRDLALGPDHNGAEANDPALGLLKEVSAGAPPDAFNPYGQSWNLAVYHPGELSSQNGAPFAGLLAANMRYASALRIDHVMGLQRLFWMISGDEALNGTYVTYPFDLLAKVLSDFSRDFSCLVVGEDLGTVPAGFREALQSLAVLGCRVLWFEKDKDSRFHPPSAYPREAVVSATTHDLPTIVGFWMGRDIELRHELGVYGDAEEHARAQEERHHARAALAHALGDNRIDATHIAEGQVPPGLCEAVHAHLARTPAMLVQVQLEDVLEARDAVNLPGTTDSQHPNWRRKLPVNLENLGSETRFSALSNLDRSSAIDL